MSDRGATKKSAIAGGTISANTFIKWNASGQAIVCSSAGEQVAGVACHDAVSGDALAYWPPGCRGAVKTAGVLTPGTHTTLATDASGLAVAAVAGDRVAATPHYNPGQAAAASGDLIECEVGGGELFDSAAIVADVATNAADIATNAADIATNTADIGVVEAVLRGVDASSGGEAANVHTVTIQVTDQDGAALAAVHTVMISLYTAAMIEVLAAAFTASIGGTGAAVTTDAQGRLIVTTDAAGVAEVSVTDVATASGATINALIQVLQTADATPVISAVRRLALVFDGA